jgi:hypothetical protein
MTEESQAQAALARVRQISEPAARAARRSVRRQLIALGMAASLAVLGSGAISHWGGERMVVVRALLVSAVWGVLFGVAVALANSQPVRALPARRQTIIVGLVSAVLIGITMGIGSDYPVAYPIGAATVFGAWALGAAWSGR